MEAYLAGTLVALVAITVLNHIRLTRMIDTIGNMLHVFMYHPSELEPWAIVASIEMLEKHENLNDAQSAAKHWTEWDESGGTNSEEE